MTKLGRVMSVTDAAGQAAATQYDIADRVVQRTGGKGTTTFGYGEPRDLATTMTDTAGTTVLMITGSYDADGNLTSETLPNGLGRTLTVDAAGRMTRLAYTDLTAGRVLTGHYHFVRRRQERSGRKA